MNLRKTVNSLRKHILYFLFISVSCLYSTLYNHTRLEILSFWATETEGSWEEFSSEEKQKSEEESRKRGFEGTFYPF